MDLTTLLGQEELCIRDLQAFHTALDREKRFDADMLRNVAYLSEEIGEVVTAIRALTKAENSTVKEAARMQLGEELADCLAYILKLANYADVDLQSQYVQKMEQNLTREWHKFSQDTPGSDHRA